MNKATPPYICFSRKGKKLQLVSASDIVNKTAEQILNYMGAKNSVLFLNTPYFDGCLYRKWKLTKTRMRAMTIDTIPKTIYARPKFSFSIYDKNKANSILIHIHPTQIPEKFTEAEPEVLEEIRDEDSKLKKIRIFMRLPKGEEEDDEDDDNFNEDEDVGDDEDFEMEEEEEDIYEECSNEEEKPQEKGTFKDFSVWVDKWPFIPFNGLFLMEAIKKEFGMSTKNAQLIIDDKVVDSRITGFYSILQRAPKFRFNFNIDLSDESRELMEKRKNVIQNFINGEASYLTQLEYLSDTRDVLENRNLLNENDIKTIFDLVDEIKEYQTNFDMKIQKLKIGFSTKVAPVLLTSFRQYITTSQIYIMNYAKIMEVLCSMASTQGVMGTILEETGYDFASLVSQPLIHVRAYADFFTAIQRLTPRSHPDFAILRKYRDKGIRELEQLEYQAQKVMYKSCLVKIQSNMAGGFSFFNHTRAFFYSSTVTAKHVGYRGESTCSLMIFSDMVALIKKRSKDNMVEPWYDSTINKFIHEFESPNDLSITVSIESASRDYLIQKKPFHTYTITFASEKEKLDWFEKLEYARRNTGLFNAAKEDDRSVIIGWNGLQTKPRIGERFADSIAAIDPISNVAFLFNGGETLSVTSLNMESRHSSNIKISVHPSEAATNFIPTAAIYCNGKIFVFTEKSVFEFDTMKHLRQLDLNFNPPRRFSYVVSDDKIYIFGGELKIRVEKKIRKTITGSIWEFDTTKRIVTEIQVNDAPDPRAFHSSVLFENSLYSICGKTRGGVTNKIIKFDLESHKFTNLEIPGVIPRMQHSSFIFNDVIVVVGGVNDVNELAPIQLIDLRKKRVITCKERGNIPKLNDGFTAIQYQNEVIVFTTDENSITGSETNNILKFSVPPFITRSPSRIKYDKYNELPKIEHVRTPLSPSKRPRSDSLPAVPSEPIQKIPIEEITRSVITTSPFEYTFKDGVESLRIPAFKPQTPVRMFEMREVDIPADADVLDIEAEEALRLAEEARIAEERRRIEDERQRIEDERIKEELRKINEENERLDQLENIRKMAQEATNKAVAGSLQTILSKLAVLSDAAIREAAMKAIQAIKEAEELAAIKAISAEMMCEAVNKAMEAYLDRLNSISEDAVSETVATSIEAIRTKEEKEAINELAGKCVTEASKAAFENFKKILEEQHALACSAANNALAIILEYSMKDIEALDRSDECKRAASQLIVDTIEEALKYLANVDHEEASEVSQQTLENIIRSAIDKIEDDDQLQRIVQIAIKDAVNAAVELTKIRYDREIISGVAQNTIQHAVNSILADLAARDHEEIDELSQGVIIALVSDAIRQIDSAENHDVAAILATEVMDSIIPQVIENVIEKEEAKHHAIESVAVSAVALLAEMALNAIHNKEEEEQIKEIARKALTLAKELAIKNISTHENSEAAQKALNEILNIVLNDIANHEIHEDAEIAASQLIQEIIPRVINDYMEKLKEKDSEVSLLAASTISRAIALAIEEIKDGDHKMISIFTQETISSIVDSILKQIESNESREEAESISDEVIKNILYASLNKLQEKDEEDDKAIQAMSVAAIALISKLAAEAAEENEQNHKVMKLSEETLAAVLELAVKAANHNEAKSVAMEVINTLVNNSLQSINAKGDEITSTADAIAAVIASSLANYLRRTENDEGNAIKLAAEESVAALKEAENNEISKLAGEVLKSLIGKSIKEMEESEITEAAREALTEAISKSLNAANRDADMISNANIDQLANNAVNAIQNDEYKQKIIELAKECVEEASGLPIQDANNDDVSLMSKEAVRELSNNAIEALEQAEQQGISIEQAEETIGKLIANAYSHRDDDEPEELSPETVHNITNKVLEMYGSMEEREYEEDIAEQVMKDLLARTMKSLNNKDAADATNEELKDIINGSMRCYRQILSEDRDNLDATSLTAVAIVAQNALENSEDADQSSLINALALAAITQALNSTMSELETNPESAEGSEPEEIEEMIKTSMNKLESEKAHDAAKDLAADTMAILVGKTVSDAINEQIKAQDEEKKRKAQEEVQNFIEAVTLAAIAQMASDPDDSEEQKVFDEIRMEAIKGASTFADEMASAIEDVHSKRYKSNKQLENEATKLEDIEQARNHLEIPDTTVENEDESIEKIDESESHPTVKEEHDSTESKSASEKDDSDIETKAGEEKDQLSKFIEDAAKAIKESNEDEDIAPIAKLALNRSIRKAASELNEEEYSSLIDSPISAILQQLNPEQRSEIINRAAESIVNNDEENQEMVKQATAEIINATKNRSQTDKAVSDSVNNVMEAAIKKSIEAALAKAQNEERMEKEAIEEIARRTIGDALNNVIKDLEDKDAADIAHHAIDIATAAAITKLAMEDKEGRIPSEYEPLMEAIHQKALDEAALTSNKFLMSKSQNEEESVEQKDDEPINQEAIDTVVNSTVNDILESDNREETVERCANAFMEVLPQVLSELGQENVNYEDLTPEMIHEISQRVLSIISKSAKEGEADVPLEVIENFVKSMASLSKAPAEGEGKDKEEDETDPIAIARRRIRSDVQEAAMATLKEMVRASLQHKMWRVEEVNYSAFAKEIVDEITEKALNGIRTAEAAIIAMHIVDAAAIAAISHLADANASEDEKQLIKMIEESAIQKATVAATNLLGESEGIAEESFNVFGDQIISSLVKEAVVSLKEKDEDEHQKALEISAKTLKRVIPRAIIEHLNSGESDSRSKEEEEISIEKQTYGSLNDIQDLAEEEIRQIAHRAVQIMASEQKDKGDDEDLTKQIIDEILKQAVYKQSAEKPNREEEMESIEEKQIDEMGVNEENVAKGYDTELRPDSSTKLAADALASIVHFALERSEIEEQLYREAIEELSNETIDNVINCIIADFAKKDANDAANHVICLAAAAVITTIGSDKSANNKLLEEGDSNEKNDSISVEDNRGGKEEYEEHSKENENNEDKESSNVSANKNRGGKEDQEENDRENELTNKNDGISPSEALIQYIQKKAVRKATEAANSSAESLSLLSEDQHSNNNQQSMEDEDEYPISLDTIQTVVDNTLNSIRDCEDSEEVSKSCADVLFKIIPDALEEVTGKRKLECPPRNDKRESSSDEETSNGGETIESKDDEELKKLVQAAGLTPKEAEDVTECVLQHLTKKRPEDSEIDEILTEEFARSLLSVANARNEAERKEIPEEEIEKEIVEVAQNAVTEMMKLALERTNRDIEEEHKAVEELVESSLDQLVSNIINDLVQKDRDETTNRIVETASVAAIVEMALTGHPDELTPEMRSLLESVRQSAIEQTTLAANSILDSIGQNESETPQEVNNRVFESIIERAIGELADNESSGRTKQQSISSIKRLLPRAIEAASKRQSDCEEDIEENQRKDEQTNLTPRQYCVPDVTKELVRLLSDNKNEEDERPEVDECREFLLAALELQKQLPEPDESEDEGDATIPREDIEAKPDITRSVSVESNIIPTVLKPLCKVIQNALLRSEREQIEEHQALEEIARETIDEIMKNIQLNLEKEEITKLSETLIDSITAASISKLAQSIPSEESPMYEEVMKAAIAESIRSAKALLGNGNDETNEISGISSEAILNIIDQIIENIKERDSENHEEAVRTAINALNRAIPLAILNYHHKEHLLREKNKEHLSDSSENLDENEIPVFSVSRSIDGLDAEALEEIAKETARLIVQEQTDEEEVNEIAQQILNELKNSENSESSDDVEEYYEEEDLHVVDLSDVLADIVSDTLETSKIEQEMYEKDLNILANVVINTIVNNIYDELEKEDQNDRANCIIDLAAAAAIAKLAIPSIIENNISDLDDHKDNRHEGIEERNNEKKSESSSDNEDEIIKLAELTPEEALAQAVIQCAIVKATKEANKVVEKEAEKFIYDSSIPKPNQVTSEAVTGIVDKTVSSVCQRDDISLVHDSCEETLRHLIPEALEQVTGNRHLPESLEEEEKFENSETDIDNEIIRLSKIAGLTPKQTDDVADYVISHLINNKRDEDISIPAQQTENFTHFLLSQGKPDEKDNKIEEEVVKKAIKAVEQNISLALDRAKRDIIEDHEAVGELASQVIREIIENIIEGFKVEEREFKSHIAINAAAVAAIAKMVLNNNIEEESGIPNKLCEMFYKEAIEKSGEITSSLRENSCNQSEPTVSILSEFVNATVKETDNKSDNLPDQCQDIVALLVPEACEQITGKRTLPTPEEDPNDYIMEEIVNEIFEQLSSNKEADDPELDSDEVHEFIESVIAIDQNMPINEVVEAISDSSTRILYKAIKNCIDNFERERKRKHEEIEKLSRKVIEDLVNEIVSKIAQDEANEEAMRIVDAVAVAAISKIAEEDASEENKGIYSSISEAVSQYASNTIEEAINKHSIKNGSKLGEDEAEEYHSISEAIVEALIRHAIDTINNNDNHDEAREAASTTIRRAIPDTFENMSEEDKIRELSREEISIIARNTLSSMAEEERDEKGIEKDNMKEIMVAISDELLQKNEISSDSEDEELMDKKISKILQDENGRIVSDLLNNVIQLILDRTVSEEAKDHEAIEGLSERIIEDIIEDIIRGMRRREMNEIAMSIVDSIAIAAISKIASDTIGGDEGILYGTISELSRDSAIERAKEIIGDIAGELEAEDVREQKSSRKKSDSSSESEDEDQESIESVAESLIRSLIEKSINEMSAEENQEEAREAAIRALQQIIPSALENYKREHSSKGSESDEDVINSLDELSQEEIARIARNALSIIAEEERKENGVERDDINEIIHSTLKKRRTRKPKHGISVIDEDSEVVFEMLNSVIKLVIERTKKSPSQIAYNVIDSIVKRIIKKFREDDSREIAMRVVDSIAIAVIAKIAEEDVESEGKELFNAVSEAASQHAKESTMDAVQESIEDEEVAEKLSESIISSLVKQAIESIGSQENHDDAHNAAVLALKRVIPMAIEEYRKAHKGEYESDEEEFDLTQLSKEEIAKIAQNALAMIAAQERYEKDVDRDDIKELIKSVSQEFIESMKQQGEDESEIELNENGRIVSDLLNNIIQLVLDKSVAEDKKDNEAIEDVAAHTIKDIMNHIIQKMAHEEANEEAMRVVDSIAIAAISKIAEEEAEEASMSLYSAINEAASRQANKAIREALEGRDSSKSTENDEDTRILSGSIVEALIQHSIDMINAQENNEEAREAAALVIRRIIPAAIEEYKRSHISDFEDGEEFDINQLSKEEIAKIARNALVMIAEEEREEKGIIQENMRGILMGASRELLDRCETGEGGDHDHDSSSEYEYEYEYEYESESEDSEGGGEGGEKKKNRKRIKKRKNSEIEADKEKEEEKGKEEEKEEEKEKKKVEFDENGRIVSDLLNNVIRLILDRTVSEEAKDHEAIEGLSERIIEDIIEDIIRGMRRREMNEIAMSIVDSIAIAAISKIASDNVPEEQKEIFEAVSEAASQKASESAKETIGEDITPEEAERLSSEIISMLINYSITSIESHENHEEASEAAARTIKRIIPAAIEEFKKSHYENDEKFFINELSKEEIAKIAHNALAMIAQEERAEEGLEREDIKELFRATSMEMLKALNSEEEDGERSLDENGKVVADLLNNIIGLILKRTSREDKADHEAVSELAKKTVDEIVESIVSKINKEEANEAAMRVIDSIAIAAISRIAEEDAAEQEKELYSAVSEEVRRIAGENAKEVIQNSVDEEKLEKISQSIIDSLVANALNVLGLEENHREAREAATLALKRAIPAAIEEYKKTHYESDLEDGEEFDINQLSKEEIAKIARNALVMIAEEEREEKGIIQENMRDILMGASRELLDRCETGEGGDHDHDSSSEYEYEYEYEYESESEDSEGGGEGGEKKKNRKRIKKRKNSEIEADKEKEEEKEKKKVEFDENGRIVSDLLNNVIRLILDRTVSEEAKDHEAIEGLSERIIEDIIEDIIRGMRRREMNEIAMSIVDSIAIAAISKIASDTIGGDEGILYDTISELSRDSAIERAKEIIEENNEEVIGEKSSSDDDGHKNLPESEGIPRIVSDSEADNESISAVAELIINSLISESIKEIASEDNHEAAQEAAIRTLQKIIPKAIEDYRKNCIANGVEDMIRSGSEDDISILNELSKEEIAKIARNALAIIAAEERSENGVDNERIAEILRSASQEFMKPHVESTDGSDSENARIVSELLNNVIGLILKRAEKENKEEENREIEELSNNTIAEIIQNILNGYGGKVKIVKRTDENGVARYEFLFEDGTPLFDENGDIIEEEAKVVDINKFETDKETNKETSSSQSEDDSEDESAISRIAAETICEVLQNVLEKLTGRRIKITSNKAKGDYEFDLGFDDFYPEKVWSQSDSETDSDSEKKDEVVTITIRGHKTEQEEDGNVEEESLDALSHETILNVVQRALQNLCGHRIKLARKSGEQGSLSFIFEFEDDDTKEIEEAEEKVKITENENEKESEEDKYLEDLSRETVIEAVQRALNSLTNGKHVKVVKTIDDHGNVRYEYKIIDSESDSEEEGVNESEKKPGEVDKVQALKSDIEEETDSSCSEEENDRNAIAKLSAETLVEIIENILQNLSGEKKARMATEEQIEDKKKDEEEVKDTPVIKSSKDVVDTTAVVAIMQLAENGAPHDERPFIRSIKESAIASAVDSARSLIQTEEEDDGENIENEISEEIVDQIIKNALGCIADQDNHEKASKAAAYAVHDIIDDVIRQYNEDHPDEPVDKQNTQDLSKDVIDEITKMALDIIRDRESKNAVAKAVTDVMNEEDDFDSDSSSGGQENKKNRRRKKKIAKQISSAASGMLGDLIADSLKDYNQKVEEAHQIVDGIAGEALSGAMDRTIDHLAYKQVAVDALDEIIYNIIHSIEKKEEEECREGVSNTLQGLMPDLFSGLSKELDEEFNALVNGAVDAISETVEEATIDSEEDEEKQLAGFAAIELIGIIASNSFHRIEMGEIETIVDNVAADCEEAIEKLLDHFKDLSDEKKAEYTELDDAFVSDQTRYLLQNVRKHEADDAFASLASAVIEGICEGGFENAEAAIDEGSLVIESDADILGEYRDSLSEMHQEVLRVTKEVLRIVLQRVNEKRAK